MDDGWAWLRTEINQATAAGRTFTPELVQRLLDVIDQLNSTIDDVRDAVCKLDADA